MSKTSPLFTANELYAHICCDCVNEIFEDMKIKYKDERLALIILCHYLDVYFDDSLYNSVKDNANFSFGNYVKFLNGIQYKAKNFTTFLVNVLKEGQSLKDIDQLREEKEVKWKASDLKNKNYVLQTVGYDCFEDESYTDEDRKFLFNTFADYLTDEVIEDPHKLQSVILMVKTTLQVENIDKLINAELRKKIPDPQSVSKLTETKNKLTSTINSLANDNGISAKTSGKKKSGANTLTNIMKEMAENGFEEIKVNIFNVKMSEAFKKIGDISNKSLLDQLNFQPDDYARMVATQRQIIQEYSEKEEKLNEEIRLLKVQLKEMKEKLEVMVNDCL